MTSFEEISASSCNNNCGCNNNCDCNHGFLGGMFSGGGNGMLLCLLAIVVLCTLGNNCGCCNPCNTCC